MIEFRVLGPVELRVSGRAVELGPARQRGILAALLVEPERPTTIESLIDRVWGDSPPDHVRGVVYTYITRLRRALADATDTTDTPVTVHRDGVGYLLGVSSQQVDLANFRELLARARAADADDPRRAEWLGQALMLWRGEALGGLNSDWALRFRATLQQLKYEVLAEWADVEVDAGRCASVIAVLRHALLEEPLAEALHERLIRALYANGQSVEALRQYERVRRAMVEELGTDPGSRLKQLHQLILQGRPLAGPALPAPAPGAQIVPAQRSQVAVPEPAPAPAVPAEARAAPRPSGPDLLPMDLADFTGRGGEIAWLHDALTLQSANVPPTVVIKGAAGVGKTSLALRVAHGLRSEFPDGRLYVDLRGKSVLPAGPAAVLTRLLRALGYAPCDVPADIDERAEVFRNTLSGKRVLIVLDDAASGHQVEPLLPGDSGCRVLVTSGVQLGISVGTQSLTLGELSESQGIEMLARIVGRERVLHDPHAAAELVRYCSGLPLALRAVANRLACRPHWTLREARARIADERRRLDELAYGPLDVRASLEGSLNRLDPAASRLFEYLGETARADSDLVPHAMPGLTPDEAQDALERLVDVHLLHVIGRDADGRIRYRMPDLHRIYARSVARDKRQADRQHQPRRPATMEALALTKERGWRKSPNWVGV